MEPYLYQSETSLEKKSVFQMHLGKMDMVEAPTMFINLAHTCPYALSQKQTLLAISCSSFLLKTFYAHLL